MYTNEDTHGHYSEDHQHDENRHHIHCIACSDERGERAKATHDESRVAAEDHVAARVEREGIEHKVVGARHRPLESECFLLQKARRG